jgi:hypothetical protein
MERSVSAEAARRDDCLKFAEVQLADRAQCLCGGTVLKAFRQAIQPGRIFSLRLYEAGDIVIPVLGPATMIGSGVVCGSPGYRLLARRDSGPGVWHRS